METAEADTDLLRTLDAQGDDFSIPRDVEFFLRAPSKEKAETVAGFINDYQYGVATPQMSDGDHSVLVVVHMPVQQHAILSVSGFMACVCELYGLDYDGWGCVTQVRP
jgi:hypothetical protein